MHGCLVPMIVFAWLAGCINSSTRMLVACISPSSQLTNEYIDTILLLLLTCNVAAHSDSQPTALFAVCLLYVRA